MKKLFLISILFFCTTALAQHVSVNVYSIQGEKNIGSIRFSDSPQGLLIQTRLKDLTPGLHGFHIHTNPSCADKGLAAGGHLDPKKTGKHLGPYNKDGHLGDLPVLKVNAKGIADDTLVAPRLSVKSIRGHSVMIHQDGDNYSDHPKPLGGGGARIACGVIR